MTSGYRVNADELINTLKTWDALLPGKEKIHLIACGGTAINFAWV